MPIYYPEILEERPPVRSITYDEKDVMLYALGVGMAQDPLDQAELAFVYEKKLKVIPTAATVLGFEFDPAVMKGDEQAQGRSVSSLNFMMMVHGEQKVELHKPLPARGSFTSEQRTVGAYDKGPEKGAIVVSETVWRDSAGDKVVTQTATVFARGDGGFGGPSTGAPEPHVVPQRSPDLTLDFATRPDQALLYRLNGDRNPLHIDPAFASKGGFPKPILHGLCTYGVTCRAVLQGMAGYDADRMLSHQVRFSAPVFPGDTITVDLWRDGANISFEAHVRDRGATVIKNGLSVLRS